MKNLTQYDLEELNNLLYDLSRRIKEYSHLEHLKVYLSLQKKVEELKEKTNDENHRRQQ